MISPGCVAFWLAGDRAHVEDDTSADPVGQTSVTHAVAGHEDSCRSRDLHKGAIDDISSLITRRLPGVLLPVEPEIHAAS